MTPFHRLGLLAAAMALVVALGVVGVYVSWIVALVAFVAGVALAVVCTLERAIEPEPPADEPPADENGRGDAALRVRDRDAIEASARRGREDEPDEED